MGTVCRQTGGPVSGAPGMTACAVRPFCYGETAASAHGDLEFICHMKK